MPTMPKLISAVIMALLGYGAADAVGGHLPPEVLQNGLRPVSAFFGIIVGWRYLGRKVGEAWRTAIGFGLSATVALVLISLLWFSGYEMIKRSLRLAYGGPFEALQDMVQIAIDQAQYLGHGDVIVVLAGGGALCGLIAEFIARRAS